MTGRRGELRAADEALTREGFEHMKATVAASEAYPAVLRNWKGSHVKIHGSLKSWGLTVAPKEDDTLITGWAGSWEWDKITFTKRHQTRLVFGICTYSQVASESSATGAEYDKMRCNHCTGS
jgi:hypothetical protein